MADVIQSERPVAAVEYPSSDGKPVAESDFQLTVLTYAREALRIHFRERENVYVAANLLIYYREGDAEVRVAPDVFVVVGASSHERMSYLLWQEPKGPDWVLEITSRSTRVEDQGSKRELYRRLGVAEYWQYDPTGDYLRPRLQGLELVAGEYEEMPGGARGDGTQVMASAVLGLELRRACGGCGSTIRRRAGICRRTRRHAPPSGRRKPTAGRRRPTGGRPKRGSRSWRRCCASATPTARDYLDPARNRRHPAPHEA